MPLARRFAFLTAGCPENEGTRNRRAVARSLGLVCMTCGAWPPCHKVRSLVHTGGDFTRDASGARVGRPTFKKGSFSRAVAMPRSSCDHRALSPFGPLNGCAGVLWSDPRQGRLFRRLHRRRACARGGVIDLVFFLLLLEGCNPMGVGILPPFGFKDFHHAARLQSPAGGHPEG
jgi:hypothetical protein